MTISYLFFFILSNAVLGRVKSYMEKRAILYNTDTSKLGEKEFRLLIYSFL